VAHFHPPHYAHFGPSRVAQFNPPQVVYYARFLHLATQEPSVYHKLPTEEIENGYDTSLNGTYFNEETDTEIVIEHVKDANYNIIKNGRKRDGKLITKDYLRMMSSYKIKVIRDENGDVQGLNLENGRIKNVIFKKQSV